METRNSRLRRFIACTLAAGVLAFSIMAMPVQTTLAEGEDEENDSSKPDITIEVVENIPAADIEESEVPLSAPTDTAAADNTRHMVIAWTLAVIAIAYAVFVISGMRRRKAHRRMQAGTTGDRSGEPGGGRR